MASPILEFSFDGVKEFTAMLGRLDIKVQAKIAKDVCKESLEPMLAAAKTNASAIGSGADVDDIDMSELMAKKLKIYLIKKRNLRPGHFGAQVRFQENVQEFVGYGMGSSSNLSTRKTTGRRAYIPIAIEYGHAFPGRGGGKNAPKDVAAVPFIRPAFDSTKEQCMARAETLVKDFVDSTENNT